MRVLLAGASGAIGMPLIERLRAGGHDVLAIHRSSEGRARLAAAGATPLQVDVLDKAALLRALDGERADAVVSELTALKKLPITHNGMAATNNLRTTGTSNLLAAASQLGATRFVTQSMVFGYGFGDWAGRVLTEADQFGPPGHGRFEEHVGAMRQNERQVFDAPGIDGIALRYGLFYGPGPAGDGVVSTLRRRRLPIVRHAGVLPWVYIDDAVAATAAALERGQPGYAYNITDNEPVSMPDLLVAIAAAVGAPKPMVAPGWTLLAMPYARAVMTGGLRVANTRATRELGWSMQAPTYHEGVPLMARHYRSQAAPQPAAGPGR
jgi:nucleoside-diphosphate-sugar epimerase